MYLIPPKPLCSANSFPGSPSQASAHTVAPTLYSLTKGNICTGNLSTPSFSIQSPASLFSDNRSGVYIFQSDVSIVKLLTSCVPLTLRALLCLIWLTQAYLPAFVFSHINCVATVLLYTILNIPFLLHRHQTDWYWRLKDWKEKSNCHLSETTRVILSKVPEDSLLQSACCHLSAASSGEGHHQTRMVHHHLPPPFT